MTKTDTTVSNTCSLREMFQKQADREFGPNVVICKDTTGPDCFYAAVIPSDLKNADTYTKTHAVVLRFARGEGDLSDDLFLSLEGERVTEDHAYDFVSNFWRSLALYIQEGSKTNAHLKGALSTAKTTDEALTEIANALKNVTRDLITAPEFQLTL